MEDLQATYETLVSRGVSFDSKPHLIAKMPDHELWMAFFRDSEKNLVGLMSEVRGRRVFGRISVPSRNQSLQPMRDSSSA